MATRVRTARAAAVPPDDIETIPPAMDYAAHERQYNRFLHLTKWFVIHLVLLLPALYFFIVAGEAVAGVLFLALAAVALGYGVISTPAVARDLGRALEDRPETS